MCYTRSLGTSTFQGTEQLWQRCKPTVTKLKLSLPQESTDWLTVSSDIKKVLICICTYKMLAWTHNSFPISFGTIILITFFSASNLRLSFSATVSKFALRQGSWWVITHFSSSLEGKKMIAWGKHLCDVLVCEAHASASLVRKQCWGNNHLSCIPENQQHGYFTPISCGLTI